MGWGNLLGQLAKEVAIDYVATKGYEGIKEDIKGLTSTAKEMFNKASGGIDWNTLTDMILEEVQNGNYGEAHGLLDEYYTQYENSTPDLAYYYWSAGIMVEALENETGSEEFLKIFQACNETIQAGIEYNDSEVNSALREFQERASQAYARHMILMEWTKMYEKCLNYLDNQDDINALKIIQKFYNSSDDFHRPDFHFHSLTYRSYVVKLQKLPNEKTIERGKQYLDFAVILEGCLKGMKSCIDETPTEEQEADIRDCSSWIETITQVGYRIVCIGHAEINDFEKARHTAAVHLRYTYPAEYNNVVCGIESRYLEYLVENKADSEMITRTVKVAEEALQTALQDDDSDSKKERISSVLPRIDKAKQYLKSLSETPTSTQGKAQFAHSQELSDSENGEKVYIEELKACYEDGEITDRERRLLTRLRKTMGISEERAAELERQVNPLMLSDEEREYVEEYKEVVADGIISEKEKRLLNRLAKSLNISEERKNVIEQMVNNNKI